MWLSLGSGKNAESSRAYFNNSDEEIDSENWAENGIECERVPSASVCLKCFKTLVFCSRTRFYRAA